MRVTAKGERAIYHDRHRHRQSLTSCLTKRDHQELNEIDDFEARLIEAGERAWGTALPSSDGAMLNAVARHPTRRHP